MQISRTLVIMGALGGKAPMIFGEFGHKSINFHEQNMENTRKYPLLRYILGVLTHTTAWDRLWGGDVFLIVYT